MTIIEESIQYIRNRGMLMRCFSIIFKTISRFYLRGSQPSDTEGSTDIIWRLVLTSSLSDSR